MEYFQVAQPYIGGIKKPGSMNRALKIFDLSVLFSLDPLSSVQSFSFW